MFDWPSAYVQHWRPAADGLPRRWVVNLGITAAVGSAYFLATSLAFGLLFKTDTIAVFWPASGVSAGALIALGWRARWPVAIGVMVAVVAIHLIASSTATPGLIGVVSGISDVMETLVIAGLVERWCGAPFTLDRLHNVIGMLAAGVIGISISGIGGIAASRLKLELPPTEPILTIWGHWVAANSIGFLTVAPLLIGLAAVLRSPPPRNEIIEGAAGVAVLAVMTAIIISLPERRWETLVPLAWLFPVFSWLAGRCRSSIVAGGVFIVSITIIWTTVSGIGHFGDPNLSFDDRILGAQVGILVIAVGAFVLAALFAERRKAEALLTRSNTMLQRERDNKLMNLQAAVGSISHEIKQPLSAILMNAASAQTFLKLVPPDLEEVDSALNELVSDGKRMGEIVDNVRQLFGKGDRDKKPIDVNTAVFAVLRLLREELSKHRITTAVELASELPPVLGHRVQLEEVIVNLVRNANEAMEAVEPARRALKVRTKFDGAKVVILEVQDSGPGIDPGRLDSIFDAFVTTKAHGTGLGLAICRMIIESHGGRLNASSDGESGALFRVVLPIVPAGAPPIE
jgi:signal transduction histidine kinase